MPMAKDIVPVAEEGLSPELAALPSEKMRAFVDALLQQDGNGKLLAASAAIRTAGYQCGGSHEASSLASKMLRDSRITAAIRAETQRRLRSLGPEAIAGLKDIVGDKFHKDRLKAVNV